MVIKEMYNSIPSLLALACMLMLVTGCATQGYESAANLRRIQVDPSKESVAANSYRNFERDAYRRFQGEIHLFESEYNTRYKNLKGRDFDSFEISEFPFSVAIERYSDSRCRLKYVGPINELNEARFYAVVHAGIKMGCKDTLLKLDSLGGQLGSGIRMGLVVRKQGYHTMPYKNLAKRYANAYGGITGDDGCYSACTLVFMGGNKRYGPQKIGEGLVAFAFQLSKQLTSDIGTLGFHQARSSKTRACIDDPNASQNLVIREHYKRMLNQFDEAVYAQYLSASCNSMAILGAYERIYNLLVTDEYSVEVMLRY